MFSVMIPHDDPSEILPLFPLNTVLFPQSQISLHIFEERYKKLINESITYDSVFGINLVLEEEIKPVGCSAVVKEVTKRYTDGRMDIVVEGRRRYTLLNLVDAPAPYHTGRVRWYDDVSEDIDAELQRRAVTMHNEFVTTVFSGAVQRVMPDDIRRARSFYLVQKAGLELVQRQAFLAMNSENRRLEYLVKHWEVMVPLLVSRKKIDELSKNDGYRQE